MLNYLLLNFYLSQVERETANWKRLKEKYPCVYVIKLKRNPRLHGNEIRGFEL